MPAEGTSTSAISSGCPADHLADSRFDSIQTAQDHLPRGDAIRGPAVIFLNRLEHHLEAVGEVGEDVIVIAGFAVVRIEDRGGATDHHRPRNEPLQMCRRAE